MTIPVVAEYYTEPDGYPAQFSHVVGEPGNFFAYGFGRIWKSAEAVVWQAASDEPQRLTYDFRYGAGTIVGVGGNGFSVSTDGINWQLFPSPAGMFVVSCMYLDGQWLAMGQVGDRFGPWYTEVRTSTDLVTWTTVCSELQAANRAGNGLFVSMDSLVAAVTPEFVLSPINGVWQVVYRPLSGELLSGPLSPCGLVVALLDADFRRYGVGYRSADGTWKTALVPPELGTQFESVCETAVGCMFSARNEDYSQFAEYLAPSWDTMASAQAFDFDPVNGLWGLDRAKMGIGNTVFTASSKVSVEYTPPTFWTQLTGTYEVI